MKKFTRGLFWGSVAGAVTGLLAAPKKGKETQRDVKRAADEFAARTEEITDTVAREVKKRAKQAEPKLREAKKALDEAISAATTEAEQVKEAEEAEIRAEVAEAAKPKKAKRKSS